MRFLKRTSNCGELRREHAGTEVILNGWVQRVRDLGSLIFVDVRDRYGVTQVVFVPEVRPEPAARARELRAEYVVAIRGVVRERESPNNAIPTGLVEVVAEEVQIINKAEQLPFEIDDEVNAGEELRLRHRYLDLRRPVLQRNFIIRNAIYQATHRFFEKHGFLEVETPFLMKSTPEGARDFLVPSRIHHGNFYALPQSPQLYKQLLMVAGFDRYMQITKCFRDEDLRADRQPEFTQIDVEMSFVDRDDVMGLIEQFVQTVWKEVLGLDIATGFPRLSWHQAMMRYGSDKPDLRYGLEIQTITEEVRNSGFAVFDDVTAAGGHVACLAIPAGAAWSRKGFDELTEHAKVYGAKGMAWMKVTAEGIQSPIAKFLSPETLQAIVGSSGAAEGDAVAIISDADFERCYTILGALRREIARRTGLLAAAQGSYAMLWVTEFPLLEFSPEENRYVARHHPFTSPLPDDVSMLDSNPAGARAQAYDLVINGYETAGGSIRIHDGAVQQRMFDLLGISREEADQKFGFLLKALSYGAPPHGGIAFGMDRLTMIVAGTENIRDVVAYPKTTSATSLMDNAPSPVAAAQLAELGIAPAKKNDK